MATAGSVVGAAREASHGPQAFAGVPRRGLRTPFRGGTVRDLAKAMLELADAGLSGRAEADWFGQDERQFLSALRGIVASGRTPADDKLELFHGRRRGSVAPIFRIRVSEREPGPHASRRHCEERSDEAIQVGWIATGAGAPSR